MTAPEPPCLPAEMAGAYVTFLKSLSIHQGISVSPTRYLRLCLEAGDAAPRFLQPPTRARIDILIGTKRVPCIYDYVGKVLLKALADVHPCVVRANRERSQPKAPEGVVSPNGVRRKHRHKFKRKGKRVEE